MYYMCVCACVRVHTQVWSKRHIEGEERETNKMQLI